jgi:fructose-1,6-bisphosphatase I
MIEPLKTSTRPLTLAQYISHQQREIRATGEFSSVMSQISLAGRVIAESLSQAGLFSRIAAGNYENIEVEAQRMDALAKETFVSIFTHSPWVSTILLAEELEHGNPMHNEVKGGKYLVFVDALDGAQNLAVNGMVGSIFGVYKRVDTDDEVTQADLLQKGSEQVAGGYIIYGPSTIMVFSSGNGVHGCTLDPGIGDFLLTSENIRIPERGLTYSANEANYHDWHDFLRRYLDHLRKRDPKSDKYYASRYSGSLIADFHRTLLQGGIYMCPGDTRNPDRPAGKRLLMYECNPLAFVAEQAGGDASTGTERILKIKPKEIKHRTPLIIGSPYEVLLYEDFAQGRKA